MKRHAFIIRLVRHDEGQVSGQLSEPATGKSAGFASLAELALLLEGWAEQQWNAARDALLARSAEDPAQ